MLGIGMNMPRKMSHLPALDLSVVVPIHNEEGNIPALLERLREVCARITSRYEIIAVDDGSRDQSWELLKKLSKSHPQVRALSFSRNFGHQIAITAGMEAARGDAVAVIDADLQDPPEVIADLYQKYKEDYDVVYAVRRQREGESWAKLFTAHLFYRMIKRLTRIEIPVDTGDFRLMNRKAIEAFLAMPERQRFVRGMIAWVGYRQVGVLYDRQERFKGQTKYTYRKMIRFALDGITSFSYLPLQLASYLGFLCAGASFLLIAYAVITKLFNNQVIHGWASTVIITLFLGGIQLLMIGMIGEYLGRIHEELKQRPLYIVRETTDIDIISSPEKATLAKKATYHP